MTLQNTLQYSTNVPRKINFFPILLLFIIIQLSTSLKFFDIPYQYINSVRRTGESFSLQLSLLGSITYNATESDYQHYTSLSHRPQLSAGLDRIPDLGMYMKLGWLSSELSTILYHTFYHQSAQIPCEIYETRSSVNATNDDVLISIPVMLLWTKQPTDFIDFDQGANAWGERIWITDPTLPIGSHYAEIYAYSSATKFNDILPTNLFQIKANVAYELLCQPLLSINIISYGYQSFEIAASFDNAMIASRGSSMYGGMMTLPPHELDAPEIGLGYPLITLDTIKISQHDGLTLQFNLIPQTYMDINYPTRHIPLQDLFITWLPYFMDDSQYATKQGLHSGLMGHFWNNFLILNEYSNGIPCLTSDGNYAGSIFPRYPGLSPTTQIKFDQSNDSGVFQGVKIIAPCSITISIPLWTIYSGLFSGPLQKHIKNSGLYGQNGIFYVNEYYYLRDVQQNNSFQIGPIAHDKLRIRIPTTLVELYEFTNMLDRSDVFVDGAIFELYKVTQIYSPHSAPILNPDNIGQLNQYGSPTYQIAYFNRNVTVEQLSTYALCTWTHTYTINTHGHGGSTQSLNIIPELIDTAFCIPDVNDITSIPENQGNTLSFIPYTFQDGSQCLIFKPLNNSETTAQAMWNCLFSFNLTKSVDIAYPNRPYSNPDQSRTGIYFSIHDLTIIEHNPTITTPVALNPTHTHIDRSLFILSAVQQFGLIDMNGHYSYIPDGLFPHTSTHSTYMEFQPYFITPNVPISNINKNNDTTTIDFDIQQVQDDIHNSNNNQDNNDNVHNTNNNSTSTTTQSSLNSTESSTSTPSLRAEIKNIQSNQIHFTTNDDAYTSPNPFHTLLYPTTPVLLLYGTITSPPTTQLSIVDCGSSLITPPHEMFAPSIFSSQCLQFHTWVQPQIDISKLYFSLYINAPNVTTDAISLDRFFISGHATVQIDTNPSYIVTSTEFDDFWEQNIQRDINRPQILIKRQRNYIPPYISTTYPPPTIPAMNTNTKWIEFDEYTNNLKLIPTAYTSSVSIPLFNTNSNSYTFKASIKTPITITLQLYPLLTDWNMYLHYYRVSIQPSLAPSLPILDRIFNYYPTEDPTRRPNIVDEPQIGPLAISPTSFKQTVSTTSKQYASYTVSAPTSVLAILKNSLHDFGRIPERLIRDLQRFAYYQCIDVFDLPQRTCALGLFLFISPTFRNHEQQIPYPYTQMERIKKQLPHLPNIIYRNDLTIPGIYRQAHDSEHTLFTYYGQQPHFQLSFGIFESFQIPPIIMNHLLQSFEQRLKENFQFFKKMDTTREILTYPPMIDKINLLSRTICDSMLMPRLPCSNVLVDVRTSVFSFEKVSFDPRTRLLDITWLLDQLYDWDRNPISSFLSFLLYLKPNLTLIDLDNESSPIPLTCNFTLQSTTDTIISLNTYPKVFRVPQLNNIRRSASFQIPFGIDATTLSQGFTILASVMSKASDNLSMFDELPSDVVTPRKGLNPIYNNVYHIQPITLPRRCAGIICGPNQYCNPHFGGFCECQRGFSGPDCTQTPETIGKQCTLKCPLYMVPDTNCFQCICKSRICIDSTRQIMLYFDLPPDVYEPIAKISYPPTSTLFDFYVGSFLTYSLESFFYTKVSAARHPLEPAALGLIETFTFHEFVQGYGDYSSIIMTISIDSTQQVTRQQIQERFNYLENEILLVIQDPTTIVPVSTFHSVTFQLNKKYRFLSPITTSESYTLCLLPKGTEIITNDNTVREIEYQGELRLFSSCPYSWTLFHPAWKRDVICDLDENLVNANQTSSAELPGIYNLTPFCVDLNGVLYSPNDYPWCNRTYITTFPILQTVNLCRQGAFVPPSITSIVAENNGQLITGTSTTIYWTYIGDPRMPFSISLNGIRFADENGQPSNILESIVITLSVPLGAMKYSFQLPYNIYPTDFADIVFVSLSNLNWSWSYGRINGKSLYIIKNNNISSIIQGILYCEANQPCPIGSKCDYLTGLCQCSNNNYSFDPLYLPNEFSSCINSCDGENATCSNGQCKSIINPHDYATTECICYDGFVGHDCQRTVCEKLSTLCSHGKISVASNTQCPEIAHDLPCQCDDLWIGEQCHQCSLYTYPSTMIVESYNDMKSTKTQLPTQSHNNNVDTNNNNNNNNTNNNQNQMSPLRVRDYLATDQTCNKDFSIHIPNNCSTCSCELGHGGEKCSERVVYGAFTFLFTTPFNLQQITDEQSKLLFSHIKEIPTPSTIFFPSTNAIIGSLVFDLFNFDMGQIYVADIVTHNTTSYTLVIGIVTNTIDLPNTIPKPIAENTIISRNEYNYDLSSFTIITPQSTTEFTSQQLLPNISINDILSTSKSARHETFTAPDVYNVWTHLAVSFPGMYTNAWMQSLYNTNPYNQLIIHNIYDPACILIEDATTQAQGNMNSHLDISSTIHFKTTQQQMAVNPVPCPTRVNPFIKYVPIESGAIYPQAQSILLLCLFIFSMFVF